MAKCSARSCNKTAVVLIKTLSTKKWVCGLHYEEVKETAQALGNPVVILDDADSRRERLMQDRMMGGR